MRATFKGGYTLAFYKADVTTGDAQETWHNQPNDTMVTNFANVRVAGDFIIFPYAPGGGGRGGGRGDEGPAPRLTALRRASLRLARSTNGIATTRSTS